MDKNNTYFKVTRRRSQPHKVLRIAPSTYCKCLISASSYNYNDDDCDYNHSKGIISTSIVVIFKLLCCSCSLISDSILHFLVLHFFFSAIADGNSSEFLFAVHIIKFFLLHIQHTHMTIPLHLSILYSFNLCKFMCFDNSFT